jgi:hypothetical protein
MMIRDRDAVKLSGAGLASHADHFPREVTPNFGSDLSSRTGTTIVQADKSEIDVTFNLMQSYSCLNREGAYNH